MVFLPFRNVSSHSSNQNQNYERSTRIKPVHERYNFSLRDFLYFVLNQKKEMYIVSRKLPVLIFTPRETQVSKLVPLGGVYMNQTMRDYLCSLASELDSRPIADAGRWAAARERRTEEYLDILGLSEFAKGKRAKPSVTATGVIERPEYTIENLYFETLPSVYVAASLYVPRSAPSDRRSAAVLYLCGHAPTPRFYYQEHPDQLARLGFIVLITDTVMFGEATGVHHGLYNRGWWHWTSLGYNPAAGEIANGIRALDVLAAHPQVDPARIGVTGISGGGGMSWWLTAADERVRALAPVCGTGTNGRQIIDRTIDGQCDCLLFPNPLGWDFPDVYALAAPRPALICATQYDDVYSPQGSRRAYEKVVDVYRALGAEDRIRLLLTQSAHAYDETSRSEIGAFLLQNLCGTPADEAMQRVKELGPSEEIIPQDAFTVFDDRSPRENRIYELHDTIVPTAKLPMISDSNQLERERKLLLDRLKERTFRHFPDVPPPLEAREEMIWAFGKEAPSRSVRHISFQSEPGWRLLTELHTPAHPDDRARRPLIVVLRTPDEARWSSERFISGFLRGKGASWNRAFLQTRGVGETAWGPDIQWHARRSLPLVGRTVASLRTYDTLRALQLFREHPLVEPSEITLVGCGEMAVPAMFAALLDGGVKRLVLHDPPDSLLCKGAPDGTSPSIELLHALRYCDVSHIPLYLWPMHIAYVGSPPESYTPAHDAFRRLGAPGELICISDLGEWRP